MSAAPEMIALMTEYERLHQSTAWAHAVLERVSGIAKQIAGGDWDDDLDSERPRPR